MILKGLARLYTKETGTQILFDVYAYDDIYEQFLKAEKKDAYDIFRLDVTWLSWLAERILVPLDEIDADIGSCYQEYIPSLIKKYSVVHGRAYALPVTPSTQLLFYRKDLFENTAVPETLQRNVSFRIEGAEKLYGVQSDCRIFCGK